MGDKVVLVQYLNRNKRIKETDIEFLQSEIRKSFNLSGNVSIMISFQWYDPEWEEWEEYVEIQNYEDVKNKEKLKVVGARCLHTPTESMVDSDTLLVEVRVLHEINERRRDGTLAYMAQ